MDFLISEINKLNEGDLYMAQLNEDVLDNGYSLTARKVHGVFHNPINGVAVTPNDSADLANPGVIRCDGSGTIKVDLLGSGQITYTVDAGSWLPVIVKRVYATGTTATGIVVHW